MFNAEGEDSFNPEDLGVAEEVAQEYVSDKELIYFRGTKNTRTSSIILRGPNDYTLDEMERLVIIINIILFIEPKFILFII